MGERDTLNHASLWQRPQAGMTHELVPGVGHFLPEAAPDLLVERVRARLR
jgi:pimeloyl-ACP methyl ester carboxylesterase